VPAVTVTTGTLAVAEPTGRVSTHVADADGRDACPPASSTVGTDPGAATVADGVGRDDTADATLEAVVAEVPARPIITPAVPHTTTPATVATTIIRAFIAASVRSA
jgi:hypothetical protein